MSNLTTRRPKNAGHSGPRAKRPRLFLILSIPWRGRSRIGMRWRLALMLAAAVGVSLAPIRVHRAASLRALPRLQNLRHPIDHIAPVRALDRRLRRRRRRARVALNLSQLRSRQRRKIAQRDVGRGDEWQRARRRAGTGGPAAPAGGAGGDGGLTSAASRSRYTRCSWRRFASGAGALQTTRLRSPKNSASGYALAGSNSSASASRPRRCALSSDVRNAA